MRHVSVVIVTVILLLVALPLVAGDDKAVCAVCGPREGAGFEPVKAKATHKGKEYFFCSVKCKVEFLKDPDAFLVTDSGTPAPAFNVKTLDGKSLSLASLKGKVVLADFWATFCIPCLNALPELEAINKKYASQGLVIVGLTVEDRPALVKKAIGKAKVTYPIAEADAALWNLYKVNALPALVLIDREGKIVQRFGGEADKAKMISAIETALRK